MTAAINLDDLARDEIVYLPTTAIDPDPDQPRLDVDEDLAESIRQHGVLQAIQVRPHPSGADDRWMIVDGERRFRGSVKAKLAAIPATITLEVEDDGDRIIRQIVRNEGKPLTPVEEAIAFKRIIESKHAGGDPKYGIVHLAKELGIAKSTISDRMAMNEIPTFWLELIAKGPLQASHAPLLHKWRAVPERYQRSALAQMQKDYRWTQRRSGAKDERLYVDVFGALLDTFFSKFAKPIAEVPGYEGPTQKLTARNSYPARVVVHAMDPAQWEPIYRKAIAAKRAKESKRTDGSRASNSGEDWRVENDKMQARQAAQRRRWNEAKPRAIAAVAAAIVSGSVDQELIEQLLDDQDAQFNNPELKQALALVPIGTSPMEVIRAVVFRDFARALVSEWSGPRDWPPIAKALRLDAKTIIATADGSADDDELLADGDEAEPGDQYDIAEDEEQVACKYCTCTTSAACELEDGSPCSWHDATVPVCSNPRCVSAYQEDVECASADAEGSDAALEPVEA